MLDKIATQKILNTGETFKAVKQLISDYGVDPSELNEYDEPTIDLSVVKSCCEESIPPEVIFALRNTFRGTPMEDCDDGDLWGCICMDFTANAKKIVQIFIDYIKPLCKKASDKEVM